MQTRHIRIKTPEILAVHTIPKSLESDIDCVCCPKISEGLTPGQPAFRPFRPQCPFFDDELIRKTSKAYGIPFLQSCEPFGQAKLGCRGKQRLRPDDRPSAPQRRGPLDTPPSRFGQMGNITTKRNVLAHVSSEFNRLNTNKKPFLARKQPRRRGGSSSPSLRVAILLRQLFRV